MSLDIWISGPEVETECVCSSCENRHIRKTQDEIYSANITHNMAQMASEAGIYQCLWNPIENGLIHAGQLIKPIEDGLALMKSDPDRFKKFNPSNGWGSYERFVPWVESFLEACKENPDGKIGVWK